MGDRIADYLKYHADSSRAMDIDIQVEAVEFLTRSLRLDSEQRLWLSFLFATTYCMATAWYIFTKIPRYNCGSVEQLEAWWRENRPRLIFQTDRRWLRSRNQWVAVVLSYRRFVRENDPREGRQMTALRNFTSGCAKPQDAYERLVKHAHIMNFGRFAMFLYSELLFHAGINVLPVLRLEEARSVRNGVVFALGIEDNAYTGREGREATPQELSVLTDALNRIVAEVQRQEILPRHRSLWSIETTLCAYKKWHLGKRYVGYYVERTIDECMRMKRLNPTANWRPLDDFARHYYPRTASRIAQHGFKPKGFKRNPYKGVR